MTKFSDVRLGADRGEWLFFGEDAYLCLRKTTHRPYQREVRRLVLSRETVEQADVEKKLDAEDAEDLAVHLAMGEHILSDWHGWDEDGREPVALNGEAKMEVIGACDGKPLERWNCDGKQYRKLEDGRFQEQVPWTRERSMAVMGDPEYGVLRSFVRGWADKLTQDGVQRVQAFLGKSRISPTGSPTTPKSQNK